MARLGRGHRTLYQKADRYFSDIFYHVELPPRPLDNGESWSCSPTHHGSSPEPLIFYHVIRLFCGCILRRLWNSWISITQNVQFGGITFMKSGIKETSTR